MELFLEFLFMQSPSIPLQSLIKLDKLFDWLVLTLSTVVIQTAVDSTTPNYEDGKL